MDGMRHAVRRGCGCFVVVARLVFSAAPAFAQGGYVTAAISGDVARFSHTESSGQSDATGGEALSFALRTGAAIGSHWGVELEFARPSEIENTNPNPIRILTPASVGGVSATPVIYPPISLDIRTRQRNTTLAAMAWASQEITRRFSLVYLGGVGFYRRSLETEYSYAGPVPLASGSTFSSTTIAYGAGPAAGIEAAVGLTDHVHLLPGVRIQGIEGGWIVRPSVGLGWHF